MQTLATIKSNDKMTKNGVPVVTKTGKHAGQPLYCVNLAIGYSSVAFFRTATQLAQDLKGRNELEYTFLAGTTIALPKGAIVEAGTTITDTTTGEVVAIKSRQYRIADNLAVNDSFASVESWGLNFIDFMAARMDRQVTRQSVFTTPVKSTVVPVGLEDLA